MKANSLQSLLGGRRPGSFRAALPENFSSDSLFKSPTAICWLLLHGVCCIISLVLGFRFSRIVFFLLFSATTNPNLTDNTVAAVGDLASRTLLLHKTEQFFPFGGLSSSSSSSLGQKPPGAAEEAERVRRSRVVVGRHGIRIRPNPHPDPQEVMKAHILIDRVQREQRRVYGVKNRRKVIVITPTYVRTFQAVHLTGLMHTLMLVPGDLVWIVVEAGGKTNETASFVANSGLHVIHIGNDSPMPETWEGRQSLEDLMRIQGLRVVREQKLDGIVTFCDDSNMHSLEFFDEIQSVNWIGALSIGILAHQGQSEVERVTENVTKEGEEKNSLIPVQGPACNSSGQLVGWHTFNSLPYKKNIAALINDKATILPKKLEWAGFVMNSRLLWRKGDSEEDARPEWVWDLEDKLGDGATFESPLALVKDASHVEPLGKCGRKVLLWWLRVEARADSKFPRGTPVSDRFVYALLRWPSFYALSATDIDLSTHAFVCGILLAYIELRWIIDTPLEIIVPAKRTPWPDPPPELVSASTENMNSIGDHPRKQKSSKLRSRNKKNTNAHTRRQVE